jgi:GNAT superfamily N-acetyltransferase
VTLSPPVPLTAALDCTGFDCGEPAPDTWLQQRAVKNESRFSRTYVVCEGNRVVAYVSLLAGSVALGAAPGGVRRNAPDMIPVAIIGRLAVDKRHAGRGLGADLLADALRRIALASRDIGIGAVLVQAKSDAAKRFYLACAGFVEFPAASRMLFLPIEAMIAGLSEGVG